MARPQVLKNPLKINLRLDGEILTAGKKISRAAGYSFGEYVSRLINADLSRKTTIAHRFPRSLSKISA